jgi:chromosome segregation ATPase
MCVFDLLRSAMRTWRVWALLSGLVLTGTAAAQQPTREQEQLRRLRQQVQQLTQEQNDAQAAAQKSSTENASLQQRLKQAESGGGSSQAKLAAAQKQRVLLEAELTSLKADHAALQARQAETKTAQTLTTTRLTQTNAELARSQQALASREAAFNDLSTQQKSLDSRYQQCTAQNTALAELGSEVITRYANRGMDEMLALREPFVQTRRVALENLVLSYRERLDAQTHADRPATR